MNTLSDCWLRDAALHLWQATLFGLAIGLVIVLLPGPARLRHFAGGLALLRFMLPAGLLAPLAGLLPWFSADSPWRSMGFGGLWMPAFVVSGNALRTPPVVLNLPLSAILAVAWGAGTVLVLGVGMIRLIRGLRAVRRREIPFSTGDRARLETLAARLGLPPGRVSGCYVPSSGWLGVVGLFRSRIVVPEGLLSALDEKEVESVLLHELVHVKRHDNLLRLCQAGVVATFWFHPLVWWLDRRLRWESESACDEEVLRVTGANRVYATGLFKAIRYALELDLPGVSGMSRMGVQSRIRAVLNHQNRKESPVKLTLTVSTLIGLFGLATLVASTPAASGGTDASAAKNQAADNSGGQNKPTPADRAATAAAGSKVFNISELDQMPVARSELAAPIYPAALRKVGLAGEVIVGFVVDEQGNVGDVKIYSSTEHGFDQAAMEAVQQWKFSPGKKDGKPVNVRMSIPIVFSQSERKPGS